MLLLGLAAVALWCAGCAGNGANPPLPKAGSAAAPLGTGRSSTPEEQTFWDALGQAGVVYISENHADDSHHEYQFDVMKGLRARGVGFIIGWEMFDLTQQPLLDEWQQGKIGTETLLEKVEWQKHWGVYSQTYEKMLRWSRSENVGSLALNAPAALTSRLARGQSLAEADRAIVPSGYRPLPGGFEHFSEQMAQNPHAAAAGGEGLRNFYRAQVLWDQTMADRIVSYLKAHPDGKLVVLIGRGHVEGGYGVPAFVKQKSGVRQLVLYPGESGGEGPVPRLARGRSRRADMARISFIDFQ